MTRVPFGWLAAVGAAASACLVVAAGRAPVPAGTELAPGFFGLLRPTVGSGTTSAVVVLVCLGVLVSCWWLVLRRVASGQLRERQVMLLVACWGAPILVGPPLLSMDAYAYLAQGAMLTHGLDPYRGGPVLLGNDSALGAVDPWWRSSPVPYGPLTLLLFRAVAVTTGGQAGGSTAGVLLLRVLAALGVAAAVAAAVALTVPARRTLVLALTALNPITLVDLVGGAHVDAVLAGVVGLAALSFARGRLLWAVLLGAIAVAVKVTALPLLVLLLGVAAAAGVRPRGRRDALRHSAALGALVLSPFLLASPALPRPLGFLGALSVPGRSVQWYAPATILAGVMHGLGALLGLEVSQPVWLQLARLLALVIGCAVVLRLLVTAWHDLHRARKDGAAVAATRATLGRVAAALLVSALCMPAVYGWYLGASLFLLVACGRPGAVKTVLVLSSLLAFSSLTPLYSSAVLPLVCAWLVVLLLLGVAAGQTWEPTGRGLHRPSTWARRPQTVPAHPADSPPAGTSEPGRHWGRLAPLPVLAGLPVLLVGLLASGRPARAGDSQAAHTSALLVAAVGQISPETQLARVRAAPGLPQVYELDVLPPHSLPCRMMVQRTPVAALVRVPAAEGPAWLVGRPSTCPPGYLTGSRRDPRTADPSDVDDPPGTGEQPAG